VTDDAPLDSAAEADLIALLGSLRDEPVELPPHVAARLHEAIAAESAARATVTAGQRDAEPADTASGSIAAAGAPVSDLSQARERRARGANSGRRIAGGFAALAGVAAAGVLVVGGISLNQPSGDIVAQDANRTSAAPAAVSNAAPSNAGPSAMAGAPDVQAEMGLATDPAASTATGQAASGSGGTSAGGAGGAAGGTMEAGTVRGAAPTVEVVSTKTNVAPANVESTVTTLFDSNVAPSAAADPVAMPATGAPAAAPNEPAATPPAPAPGVPAVSAEPKSGPANSGQPSAFATPDELTLLPARYSAAAGTFAATSEGLGACLEALGAPASDRIEVALVTWANEPAVLIAEQIATGAADQSEFAVWVVGTGCSAADTQLRWASRFTR